MPAVASGSEMTLLSAVFIGLFVFTAIVLVGAILVGNVYIHRLARGPRNAREDTSAEDE